MSLEGRILSIPSHESRAGRAGAPSHLGLIYVGEEEVSPDYSRDPVNHPRFGRGSAIGAGLTTALLSPALFPLPGPAEPDHIFPGPDRVQISQLLLDLFPPTRLPGDAAAPGKWLPVRG